MNWLIFFFLGWGIPFTAYVIAQIAALVVLRGRFRWLALAPVAPMAGVVYYTAEAWKQQSNLWPIVLIFASPMVLGYLVVLALIARGPSPRKA